MESDVRAFLDMHNLHEKFRDGRNYAFLCGVSPIYDSRELRELRDYAADRILDKRIPIARLAWFMGVLDRLNGLLEDPDGE